MIQLASASRWYGMVIGLNDVSCTIAPGITALIGQNGAGKSTMIKLISGQIRPTTGSVHVFDEAPFANGNVFRRLGYCPEIDNFYENLSGREFINMMARLSGMNAAQAKQSTDKVIEELGMGAFCDRVIQGYSKGMRQRVKLGQAIVHNPDVILLDEPLNGLDPVARHEFMMYLGFLADQGKAIVVSSHILFELEQLTRSILLLHRGRLLASGNLRTIRSLIDKHPHRIRLISDDPRRVAQTLIGVEGVISVTVRNQEVNLQVNNADHFYSSLPKLVLENGLQVNEFISPDNNLEAVFRYLVEN